MNQSGTPKKQAAHRPRPRGRPPNRADAASLEGPVCPPGPRSPRTANRAGPDSRIQRVPRPSCCWARRVIQTRSPRCPSPARRSLPTPSRSRFPRVGTVPVLRSPPPGEPAGHPGPPLVRPALPPCNPERTRTGVPPNSSPLLRPRRPFRSASGLESTTTTGGVQQTPPQSLGQLRCITRRHGDEAPKLPTRLDLRSVSARWCA